MQPLLQHDSCLGRYLMNAMLTGALGSSLGMVNCRSPVMVLRWADEQSGCTSQGRRSCSSRPLMSSLQHGADQLTCIKD
jgi:hypothetical protein